MNRQTAIQIVVIISAALISVCGIGSFVKHNIEQNERYGYIPPEDALADFCGLWRRSIEAHEEVKRLGLKTSRPEEKRNRQDKLKYEKFCLEEN